MTDILSVRDHSKPCEHTVAFFKERDEELPTEWLHLQAGYGWCEECPGGRERTFRYLEECCTRCGAECDDHSVDVWLEVTDD